MAGARWNTVKRNWPSAFAQYKRLNDIYCSITKRNSTFFLVLLRKKANFSSISTNSKQIKKQNQAVLFWRHLLVVLLYQVSEKAPKKDRRF